MELANFVTNKELRGAGYSSVEHHYSFIDPAVSGNYTYRLKDSDYAGRVSILAIVSAEAKTSKQIALTNYPNPFNPQTHINVILQEPGYIQLDIYDARGKFIRNLFDGYQQSGNHSILFKAGQLASGFYFYRLQSNGRNLIQKMLLLR